MASFRKRAGVIFRRLALGPVILGLPVCSLSGEDAGIPGDPVSPGWSPAEILEWDPAADPDAPFNVSKVPLASRFLNPDLNVNPHARPNEGKVMVLAAFNRLPKRSAQGTHSLNFYAPTYWQYMDTFCYWGGSDRDKRLILTPAAHVVDAAHRNGVPIYGKIFFAPLEYGGDFQRVKEFLKKSGGKFPVADKLIEAANYFGFDGWFINQETPGGTSSTADDMRDFIQYIRENSSVKIIWYDAMNEAGGVGWQGAFNDSNDMFLKDRKNLGAHTLFIDFRWSESSLEKSRKKAEDLKLDPYDLFTGIDTEGRGYTGDWEKIFASIFPEKKPHLLSLGIYRPEWTFNGDPALPKFYARDNRFWTGPGGDPSMTESKESWKGIAHYIPARSPIQALPFVTHFNAGHGKHFAMGGQTVLNHEWTHLSTQDILPTWRWLVKSEGPKLKPSLDFEEPYYGGTCLKVEGALEVSNDLWLYQTSLPVSATTTLELVYNRGTTGASGLQVGLAFEGDTGKFEYLDVGAAAAHGWNTFRADLPAYAGKKIAVISFRFSAPQPIPDYQIRIGRLAIVDGEEAAPAAPGHPVLLRQDSVDSETLSVRMKWDPSADPVYGYHVYQRNEDGSQAFLGFTPNSYFFAPAVRKPKGESILRLAVEAIGPARSAFSRKESSVPLAAESPAPTPSP
jgi:endo-beta-N-acetylglucosaminidase D